jgi:hypothetical protein
MMRKWLTTLLGVLALWVLLPAAESQAAWGCSCVHNTTGRQINFRYRFGNDPWKIVHLQAGWNDAICWNYGNGPHTSPPLLFQIDVDLTAGNAWTTYTLVRWQSQGNTCNFVPPGGHYDIAFRPGTNNQFVRVVKRVAGGQPPPGQNQYGCSCVHNETGRQINFRYRFGNDPWKVVHLQAGWNDAICWNYGAGPHTSPPLRFQLDVDLTNSNAWVTYTLVRWQSPGNTCASVPAQGHYAIRFRPGTNNQFVHVVKR